MDTAAFDRDKVLRKAPQSRDHVQRAAARLSITRQPLLPANRPNAVWSMDFVSDALASGRRRLKCLTVANDFGHECVDIAVDHGISGAYVVRLLKQAA